ncbi:MAG: UDP-galactopyranose mutase [Muribaculaceae bacterium]|nr:UDP-galactopyranose mutase [Muribaculaceae bacterium]
MMSERYDYLIVGAGLYGATFAYMAGRRGKRCLVIDKRSHAGGNVYCREVAGINVHVYGAHIFHTNDREVWDLVNSIVPFNRYTNCPVAVAPDGRLYNLPFNMNTFYQMWGVRTPEEAQVKLDEQRREARERMAAEGATEPRNLEEQALTLIGRDVYEQLIKGYTEKQWGRRCTELPPFIIRRLPVRLTFDNNYFNDAYQGIPVGGYNRLIEGLLEGADVVLDSDFFADRGRWEGMADRIVFTGRIDEFYGFRFGRLDYRSIRLETEVLEVANWQGNAVVNYTSGMVPWTRIIEHKHFEAFGAAVYDNQRTVISRECPAEWAEGMEPFYPVNDARNQETYMKYKALADREERVIFGGRLAEYRYYDMAPVMAAAMRRAEEV